jgi:Bifunctional DNA primase/polymerase, N-terminal
VSLLDAANRYREELNFSILAVGMDKKPLGAWKERQEIRLGRKGLEAALNDPRATGIAVATGPLSDVTVIDLEAENLEHPEVLELIALTPPGTPRARSGGGGLHFFFAYAGGRNAPIVSSAGESLGDTREDGGYLLLPPSLNAKGVYRWEIEPSGPLPVMPEDFKIALNKLIKRERPKPAPAPVQVSRERIVRELNTLNIDPMEKYVMTALEREVQAVRNAPEGMRNTVLNTSSFNVGTLVGANVLSESDARQALEDAATAAGLDAGEIGPTITSGLAAGIDHPRDMAKVATKTGKTSSKGSTKTLAVLGEDADTFVTPDVDAPPELDDAALHGLAGDVVRAVLPHTEAHGVAILISFLVVVGIAVGNQIAWNIGGTPHPLRIFFVMVGISGKGRKGTSWGAIRRVLDALGEFMKHNITTGLSSGEGLIAAVRDEITKKDKEGDDVVVDPGVSDKRLVVLESEFGRVLKAMAREGNTLSAVARQAWEIGPDDVLRVMTKQSTTASGPHIGVIGHVTNEELLQNLESVDMANGYANRHMFAIVGRTKLLPFGGNPDQDALQELGQRLGQVMAWAASVTSDPFGQKTITWAEETKPLWAAMYGELTEGTGGLAGAVLSRSEAYVTRLAGLYAALDQTLEVRPEHLAAAVALWDYSQSSVFQIFGRRTGDLVADQILEGLKAQSPLTKTQVMALFDNNRTAAQIDAAVGSLLEAGRVRRFKGVSKNGGKAPDLLELIEVPRG